MTAHARRTALILSAALVLCGAGCEKVRELQAADPASIAWHALGEPNIKQQLESSGITPEAGGDEIANGVERYVLRRDQGGLNEIAAGIRKAGPEKSARVAAAVRAVAALPGVAVVAPRLTELADSLEGTASRAAPRAS